MRVSELIEQLKTFDGDKGILLQTQDGEWKDPKISNYDQEDEGMHVVRIS